MTGDRPPPLDATRDTASLAEVRIRHAAELAAVEREANTRGGDLTLAEVVALLLRRGWRPPGHD